MGNFRSSTKSGLTLQKIIGEISNFVGDDPKSFYNVVIGSDSKVKHNNGVKQCDYVTAIVIHRKGVGARYFWKREKVMSVPVFRDRIYTETVRSLDTAHKLMPYLRKSVSDDKYNFEIHIDVGTVGKTRDMIKEVVGMVNGNGFTAKTKPDSWGASSVADRHT